MCACVFLILGGPIMRMVLSPSGDWSRQATASQQTRSVIPRSIACCLLPQTFALFRFSWQALSRAQCKSVSALLVSPLTRCHRLHLWGCLRQSRLLPDRPEACLKLLCPSQHLGLGHLLPALCCLPLPPFRSITHLHLLILHLLPGLSPGRRIIFATPS